MTWHPGQAGGPAHRRRNHLHRESGGTLVTLVHSGWESMALPASADGSTVLDNYIEGWETVLGAYAADRTVVGAA